MRCCASVLLALLMAVGPQALLQGIAWSGMLVSYSLQDGLSQGWRDTFSGERPCDMCVALQASELEPAPNPVPREDLRLQLPHWAVAATRVPCIPPLRQVSLVPCPEPVSWVSWRPQPATPVPISA